MDADVAKGFADLLKRKEDGCRCGYGDLLKPGSLKKLENFLSQPRVWSLIRNKNQGCGV
jgi:hypothetical protein